MTTKVKVSGKGLVVSKHGIHWYRKWQVCKSMFLFNKIDALTYLHDISTITLDGIESFIRLPTVSQWVPNCFCGSISMVNLIPIYDEMRSQ